MRPCRASHESPPRPIQLLVDVCAACETPHLEVGAAAAADEERIASEDAAAIGVAVVAHAPIRVACAPAHVARLCFGPNNSDGAVEGETRETAHVHKLSSLEIVCDEG